MKKRKRSDSRVEAAKGIDYTTVPHSGGSSEHSHVRSQGGSPGILIDDAYLLGDQMSQQTNQITGHDFADVRGSIDQRIDGLFIYAGLNLNILTFEGESCKEVIIIGNDEGRHSEIRVESAKVNMVEHNMSANTLLANADCDLPIQVLFY